MQNPKPYESSKDLLERLKSRGMVVHDEPLALHRLEKIGYYRLAAYWHPFRRDVALNKDETDAFVSGTSFDECHAFYIFDKELRSFLSDPLERVEIALRARLADTIGRRDPVGHRTTSMLDWPKNSKVTHGSWLSKQDKNFQKSPEDFAVHFRQKYSGHHPPIWVTKETWDWGTMSHLINGLSKKFSHEVSEYFGYRSGPHLGSWAKSLNILRNDCAHHSRVWNRGYSIQPMRPKRGAIPDLDHLYEPTHRQLRFYALAAVLMYLCRQAYPRTEIHLRFKEFIQNKAPTHCLIDAKRTGFPRDWQEMDLWS